MDARSSAKGRGSRRPPLPAGVIQSKCRVPPVSGRLVERPRLETLVASLISAHSPVLVYATAGSGKTTAVVQALARVPTPVAWLTLDQTDTAPGRLVTYLEAALATVIPAAASVATDALRQRIPHREAAGLLAEAAGAAPVLIVIDELEWLAKTHDALGVMSAFVRYAPDSMRVVLISRVELTLDLRGGAAFGRAAALGEDDLAFTAEEAADALARRGQHTIDPKAAVEVTGGWVAGVLFEAWRSADHVIGAGGEGDPLYGYLSSQVLGQLDSDLQSFLVETSLLSDVTAARAEALGQAGAAARLADLRSTHLPVAWADGNRVMRCHTRFREYLLTRLERRPPSEVKALHEACANLLSAEGHHEEAVDEFLRAGKLPAALTAAELALDTVVERLDFALAARWIEALRPVAPPGDSALTRAELMIALIGEHYRDGVRIADQLSFVGERDALARKSPRAASMMAWCYWHLGRVDDARHLAAIAPDSEDTAAARYLLALVDGQGTTPPDPSGGPLDALIMRVNYAHGRLREMASPPASPWAEAVSAAWRIHALRALGHTQQALDLYEAYGVTAGAPVWFQAIVEPELMIDLDRPKPARDALEHGRTLVRESSSVVSDMLNRLIEAKLELRLNHDPKRASTVLDELERLPEARAYGFIAEQLDTWRGMALLRLGHDAAAARRLRRATKSMRSSDRILKLPTAAIYLAEAEERLGRPRQAEQASELALQAAARQGSNHLLLKALADFPAVAARRIQTEEHPDSVWHELGRALMKQDASIQITSRALVHLDEFGDPTIWVDRVLARPRIRKSYELLAYIATLNGREPDRDELLHVLFDGRSDDSTRSYLRQAIHRLRQVLPGDAELAFKGTKLHLAEGLTLTSERTHAEQLIAQAARMHDEQRLELLLQAIDTLNRGAYLTGTHTLWADQQRQELAHLTADAQHDAAKLAHAAGRHQQARRLANAVLNTDPYRETTWRLLMTIASATGDSDRVVSTYRLCERALAQLGATPSPQTRQLLSTLRNRATTAVTPMDD